MVLSDVVGFYKMMVSGRTSVITVIVVKYDGCPVDLQQKIQYECFELLSFFYIHFLHFGGIKSWRRR